MKTFKIKNQNVQISVFAKTGTTFMGSLRREHSDMSVGTYTKPDTHYISVRYPLDRFISGFCTLYYRSHQDNKTPEYQELYDRISNMSLHDAFYECYYSQKNNWDFDDHTINCYSLIPEDHTNITFINFRDIGILLSQLGYNPININNVYFNDNPDKDKQYIHNVIHSDKDLYNDIQNYLGQDLGIYQKLPIFRFNA